MREHFVPIFIEKDDEPALVERYRVVHFPAFVWTDGSGAEVSRSVQPADADELTEELEDALVELGRVAPSDE